MKTGNRNICSVMTTDTASCQFAVTIRYCHDTSTFDDAATKFSFTTDSILSHSLTFLQFNDWSMFPPLYEHIRHLVIVFASFVGFQPCVFWQISNSFLKKFSNPL
jgi:hypothetical protein